MKKRYYDIILLIWHSRDWIHTGLSDSTYSERGTAVAQWLRRCATNWKVTGSIPAGVIGIFH